MTNDAAPAAVIALGTQYMIYHIYGVHQMQCSKFAQSTARGSRGRAWRSNPANLAAHLRRTGEARIEFPNPLSWWRVRPAHSFGLVDVLIARQFLRKIAIVGEPFWFLGASGNAAVAIRVAVRVQKQDRPNPTSLDAAMTAVLCIALAGHAPAVIFLSSALRQRSHVEPHCGVLSNTWLVLKSRKRLARPACSSAANRMAASGE